MQQSDHMDAPFLPCETFLWSRVPDSRLSRPDARQRGASVSAANRWTTSLILDGDEISSTPPVIWSLLAPPVTESRDEI